LHSERFAAILPGQTRIAVAFASLSMCLGLTACGNNYRPVISSISPVGPASQPTKYAVAISAPSPTSPGLLNIVDFSGDDVLVTTAIGVNPQFLQLGNGGGFGFTLNGDGTVTSFSVTSGLIQSNVDQTTLPAGAKPISITPSGGDLYITQSGLNNVAQLTNTVPPAIQQQLPNGAGTTYVVGAVGGTPRAYALVQNGTSSGQATAIETSTDTISNTIPVGVAPVYGVETADDRRAFVMNKGSNTVTVINVQANALDSFPAYPNATIPVGTAPVWADFAPTLNELLVANQGNGTTPGSVSVINIPLCNTSTTVSNPDCDVNNPVDATGFGQVIATIPVGVNPQQIAVLQDGSQAFVSNAGNAALGVEGSITVINLTTNTVVATIPAISTNTSPTDSYVHGHPGFIVVTTGLPTGKAYVTAPDSDDLTIIRTDTDAVDTHLTLQGAGVMVRMTAP
jgi:DNA-binding beta-propeller fold protein YncE